jgi:hypothetical protein
MKDEVSLLIICLVHRLFVTFQSTSVHNEIEFGGHSVFVVGDRRQLSPVVAIFSMSALDWIIDHTPPLLPLNSKGSVTTTNNSQ